MKSCIYRFRNRKNGKVYIGQTSYALEKRISEHLCNANRGSRYKFHHAIRKHGLEAFDIEIIYSILTEDIKYVAQMEKHFIAEHDSYRNGYNMTEGGQGGPCSIEKARKISVAKKGKPMPWMVGNKVATNYIWATNGIDNLRLHKDADIPEGFRRGRINKPSPRMNGTKRPKFPNGYKVSKRPSPTSLLAQLTVMLTLLRAPLTPQTFPSMHSHRLVRTPMHLSP
jgi:group I intron endonuclease